MATGRVSLRGYLEFAAGIGRYIQTSLVCGSSVFPRDVQVVQKLKETSPSTSCIVTRRLAMSRDWKQKTAFEVTRRSFTIYLQTPSLFTPQRWQNLNLNSNSFLMSTLPWYEICTSDLWYHFHTWDDSEHDLFQSRDGNVRTYF